MRARGKKAQAIEQTQDLVCAVAPAIIAGANLDGT